MLSETQRLKKKTQGQCGVSYKSIKENYLGQHTLLHSCDEHLKGKGS